MSVQTAGRRAVLTAALATLAGCQTAAPPMPPPTPTLSLGPGNSGYMLLAAPITATSAGFFATNIDKFVGLGATEIHVAISSPGGVIHYAEAMIAAMDRAHADHNVIFVTHDVGLVASAACYVFLAGQRRLANARGAFLFHQEALQTNGPLTSQLLQEASTQVQQDERVFANMLRTRTRLTEGEASSFIHRTVILTSAEARRDGIIDAVEEFSVPKGVVIAAIATRPPPNAPKPLASPATPG